MHRLLDKHGQFTCSEERRPSETPPLYDLEKPQEKGRWLKRPARELWKGAKVTVSCSAAPCNSVGAAVAEHAFNPSVQ